MSTKYEAINEPAEDNAKHPVGIPASSGLGQRHILVLLAHLGTALVYCMRVSLSVALVAMVNSTEPVIVSNGSEDNQCHPPAIFAPSEDDSAPPGEFDWPRGLQGLILSSFFWGYIITQMPAGLLTQRLSCKWLFGIGTLWTAVLTLLTPLAARTNVGALLGLRMLVGVGEGITLPAILSMLGRWSPPSERAFLYAVVSSATLGGTVIGQMLAGPMCRSTWLGGWPSVFYIFGGVSVLWIIPWALLTSDDPDNHPCISRDERRYIRRTIGVRTASVRPPVPWKELLSDPAVWSFAICALSHAWIFYTFLTCLPQFLADVLGFDIAANGVVSSFPYICGFPVALICAWVSDRLIESERLGPSATRKIFNLIAYFGQAGCLLGIIFVGCNAWASVGLLVAAFCLDGAVHGGYHPNALDHAPMFAGIIHGISNTLSTAAGIAAPAITDLIAVDGTAEEWAIIFYIGAGVAVLGGVSFAVFGSADLAPWAKLGMGGPLESSSSLSTASGSLAGVEKSLLRSIGAMSGEHYAYVEIPAASPRLRRPTLPC